MLVSSKDMDRNF